MSERIIGKIIRNSFVNGKIEGKQRANGRVCIVPPVEEIITKFKSMAYFFSNNYNNEYYGALNTSEVLLADYIFKNNSMSEIEIDLSNCYSMVGGFLNSTVEKVTFTNGTANLQKANNLFRGCTKLTEVKGLDLTNCDSVKYMFMNCESLTDKIEFETNATDLSYMFMNCKSLERVWLSVPNINIATGMFTGCEALREVAIYSVCSFSVLFNELPTVESGILYLNNDYYDTVSAETKAIAQNKGWTVKQATFLHP